MNYYAIQVEENKETIVKDNLLNKFKDINIYIPIMKIKTKSGNHIAFSYEKSLPDYLIIECNECAEKIKKMSGMTNVSSVLMEEMPQKEVKRFINEEAKFEDSKHEALITDGFYSGRSGKITLVDGDFVNVKLENKQKIRVPVWFVEQKIAVDDLMGGLS